MSSSLTLKRLAPVAARCAARASRPAAGARGSPAAWRTGLRGAPRRFLCSKDGKAAAAAETEGDAAAAEGGDDAAAAEAEAAAAAEPTPLEAAEAALATARGERDDLKNQLLRALAEAENTRTIARRDVRNAKDFAAQSFAKALLDVSDSLSYAAAAGDGDDAPTVATLLEGVQLTRTQLTKAFASNGVVEFGEVGDAFDPAVHEALFEYPDADKAPGDVGQLVKTGFKLHGRVIRAAQVGVVKKP